MAGLSVGRLECGLSAKVAISEATSVGVSNGWDGAGIGWHEITAVGTGVSLKNSPVPATSISDELRHYPNDLLSSPLDVRSANLDVTPGSGASTYAKVKDLPVAGFAVRELNKVSNDFNSLVGRKNLGLGVGSLAVLLSMALGAGHAFLPGHGKTVMAAYLVGRRGRLRDVATVGATVTITHTVGVLVLGLLIALGTQFATTVVEQDLAIISGAMVALVGVGLLISAVRRRRGSSGDHDHDHDHAHAVPAAAPAPAMALAGAAAAHGHDHHEHPHDEHPHDEHAHHDHAAPALHSHGWGKAHSHGPADPNAGPDKGFSRGGLIGLGAAGGLVPSPSALLVLLAAITAGRTYFGIGLVLAYGLGMAAALCLAGLLVVRMQDRFTRLLAGRGITRLGWVAAAMPVLTASLVLVVGLGLMTRAISGSV